MALVHQFAIIDKESRRTFIEEWMEKVDVSDNLIIYMKDSLKWIETCCNDSFSNKSGLNYYGYTIIKDENIRKFQSIIECWISLFQEAPEEFILTGNYLPDEEKYESNFYRKQEVITELNALKVMCNKALLEGAYILHNGI